MSPLLPSLLYLGDVPVESSYHGSALLYRLFETYPRERLLLVEAAPWRSDPLRRLNGANYRAFQIGWGRLLNSRFARVYGSWVMRRSAARVKQLRATLNGFQPSAVVTVVHGYSWLTAAEYARQADLPLHLILHDDWLSSVVAMKGTLAEKLFRRYYSYAASRFCVSPAMAQRYYDLYGVPGEVLYPLRAKEGPVAAEPVCPRRRNGLVVAYAGTINGEGYIRLLKTMAAALHEMDGTLRMYGPMTPARARDIGLGAQNIVLSGLVPSEELVSRLRLEADALFVPMSFRSEDRTNMELSFPSKLTDYTATGLPLLINGPDYSSAIRWAQDNPGVAAIVEDQSVRTLSAVLETLKDHALRRDLGNNALAAGQQWFSWEKVFGQFRARLVLSRTTGSNADN